MGHRERKVHSESFLSIKWGTVKVRNMGSSTGTVSKSDTLFYALRGTESSDNNKRQVNESLKNIKIFWKSTNAGLLQAVNSFLLNSDRII